MTKSWTRVDISCGTDMADDLGAELAERFGASVEFIPEGVRIYFDSAFFGEKRPLLEGVLEYASKAHAGIGKIEWSFAEIPDEDWSETWKVHFKPLRVGRRFLVTPTWEEVNPGPEDLVIRIDPGRAFGTGHHETTRLCLEWLETWAESVRGEKAPGSHSHFDPPVSLLDVGTGSGILVIGAALLGFKNIVGIDNDPEAIEVAGPNVELNGLAGKILVLCASPGDLAGDFDVVISNIQALPLMRMSETLVSKARAGGRLVLSGILAEQAEEVQTVFEKRGAELTGSSAAGEWVLMDFVISGKVLNG